LGIIQPRPGTRRPRPAAGSGNAKSAAQPIPHGEQTADRWRTQFRRGAEGIVRCAFHHSGSASHPPFPERAGTATEPGADVRLVGPVFRNLCAQVFRGRRRVPNGPGGCPRPRQPRDRFYAHGAIHAAGAAGNESRSARLTLFLSARTQDQPATCDQTDRGHTRRCIKFRDTYDPGECNPCHTGH
jgi:hypothetical protein